MRNKSTIAKLLSEEDINVVQKQATTASFDVKERLRKLSLMSLRTQELKRWFNKNMLVQGQYFLKVIKN